MARTASSLPSFTVQPDDVETISAIAARAHALDVKFNGKRAARPPLEVQMDVTAAHANGNPLRLRDLLDADDFNFAHDVFGIGRHLDRTTGELTGFFSPRFSQRDASAVSASIPGSSVEAR